MNQVSYYARVYTVVRAVAADPGLFLTPGTTLNELGFDSIDKVDLAYRLEQEFGIKQVRDDWPDKTTLAQITNNIRAQE